MSFPATKLGFGLMRLPLTDPNVPSSIDLEKTKEMVDTFLSRGFTYFDTAWMYCDHESETAIRKALVERYPRESYTLATKLHAGYIKEEADRDRIFEEQCRKTGVDYFDYYLIHDVRVKHYEIYQKFNCFEWIREKKAKGLVKNIGFSFHDNAEFLDRVLTEQPYFDFVQLQINYLDWESESVQSRKCYEVARKHDIPIVVMEPVKGGTLANVPPAVRGLYQSANPKMSVPSWAIRFVAGLPGVAMVLSGMSNMEQMIDNTSYMQEFVPLNEEEQRLIRQATELIDSKIAIPCTGCAYCVEGCPMNIAIPNTFALYNAGRAECENAPTAAVADSFAALLNQFGSPAACIACGQCEGVCPQQLPIIEKLKEVSAYFGA